MAEITSTSEMAEGEWDGSSEPEDVRSDLVATEEPQGKGIEFHVSMRDYTLSDMEALIVEAAARTIVGKHNDHALSKQIEDKCIELIAAKADKALSLVTSEIIDQPVTPKYSFMPKDDKPVTMREFIGLTGQAYLMASVDSGGNPSTSGYHCKPRIQYLVERFMDIKFKREIEHATNAAIAEMQRELKGRHDALLKAETARLREAIAKLTA